MKKHVFGRKLKRDTNERTALFKNLLTSLVLHERIKTTHEKAKAIRPAAERLVTKAKKGGTQAYRSIEAEVNHDAVKKLIDEIAPRFMSRQGGYTRIIKTGRRIADNASMVVMEWTERSMALVVPETAEVKGKKRDEVQSTAKVAAKAKSDSLKGKTKKQTTKPEKKLAAAKKEKKENAKAKAEKK